LNDKVKNEFQYQFYIIYLFTYLENYFLTKANLATYSTSFIQNYLYAIIYPINLTKEIQISLGIILIIINGIIYGFIIKRK